MKKLLVLWVFIFFGALVFSGCGGETQLPSPTDTRPPPTLTHTSTATQTLTSTPTPTPTFTQTSTITLTPTNTLTPIPTLSSDIEKDAYALNLIETNGGCTIPCHWGIEAGASTWQDVRDVFRPLTTQPIPNQDRRFDYSRNLYDDVFETFGLVMYGESDYVDYLGVRYDIEPIPGWDDYNSAVRRIFSFSEILAENGLPSDVYLGIQGPGEQGAGVLEYLFLVYDEPGFIVKYLLHSNLSPELGLAIDDFCFYEEWMSIVSLYVGTPRYRSLYEIALSDYVDIGDVEEIFFATGLNVEDFYDIVMSGETEPCFQLTNL